MCTAHVHLSDGTYDRYPAKDVHEAAMIAWREKKRTGIKVESAELENDNEYPRRA